LWKHGSKFLIVVQNPEMPMDIEGYQIRDGIISDQAAAATTRLRPAFLAS
jgi:hypothetical protein